MKTNNILSIGFLGTAFAFMATSVVAQVGDISDRSNFYNHGHDAMWSGGQWGGSGMILGPIFMILVMVAIIAGAIYVLRLVGDTGSVSGSHQAHDRAIAILKERFAKGEIDHTEFNDRKKLLIN